MDKWFTEFVQFSSTHPDERFRNIWYVRGCPQVALDDYRAIEKSFWEHWDGCQVASNAWGDEPWLYLNQDGNWYPSAKMNINNQWSWYYHTKEEAEAVLKKSVPPSSYDEWYTLHTSWRFTSSKKQDET